MEKLVIFGSGGLAREVLWVARDVNRVRPTFEILGFIEDNPDMKGRVLSDLPVLGGFEWIQEHLSPELRGICGIGNTIVRNQIAHRGKKLGLRFTNVIHPSVLRSNYVELGEGVVITAGNILTTQVEIHDHVFLNLDCTVGHDAVLERFVNCAPGCNISGDVRLKQGAHLGTGVKVIQGLTVGEYTKVGAGAVVTRDLPPSSVAVGIPAKVIRKRESAPRIE